MQREVVVLSGARTAIGTYGGALKDMPPSQLGALVVREAIQRAGVTGDTIGQVVLGHVIHTEPRDMYISRVAAVNGGVPHTTPALTLNRLCGSGLQAIVSAAQTILLGDTDCAIGGGAESMSRSGYMLPAMRWGARMADAKALDMMVGALTDPFEPMHMGITAENIAAKWEIGREQQDAFALQSQQRAAAAIAEGRFKSQIVPVEIKGRKGVVRFDTDEHVKADATLEGLAKLKPAFQKENGSVTPGNASGLNDGAAALVLMERSVAEQRGLKPIARLVSYAVAGVEPKYMGIGPVPASKLALQRAGLQVGDIDVIESNEAFAAQACAVAKELNFDAAKVNPNGGAIALGHPIGASGAIIAIKAIYELQRTGGRYALATMCIGGGQGIAAVFERL